jgi:hypothetical protein
MRMRTLLAILATISATAALAGPDTIITLFGGGLNSCGTWTAARRARNEAMLQLEQWVSGYLSANAVNIALRFESKFEMNMLAVTDSDAVYAAIDNYCATHPLNSVANATDFVSGQVLQRALQFKGINVPLPKE